MARGKRVNPFGKGVAPGEKMERRKDNERKEPMKEKRAEMFPPKRKGRK